MTRETITKVGKYTFHVTITSTPDPERVKKGYELLCRYIAQNIIKRMGAGELLLGEVDEDCNLTTEDAEKKTRN